MKWVRYRNKNGRIYYQSNVSDYVVLQVWQEENIWRWAVIGWPNPSEYANVNSLVLRQGKADTLKTATKQIESIVPKIENQLMVWNHE